MVWESGCCEAKEGKFIPFKCEDPAALTLGHGSLTWALLYIALWSGATEF